MQKFKVNDLIEDKFINAGLGAMESREAQRDLFYENCYEAFPLGEVLHDTKKAPLTRAIKREIFRETFKEIFETFISGGTFEAYLTVFRKIFGDTVTVDFTVPAPGKLNIDVAAEGVVLSDLITRYIEDDLYYYDEVVDDEGDNIALQTIKGFETQYELEQMLFEMVPGGIFTEISLTVGV